MHLALNIQTCICPELYVEVTGNIWLLSVLWLVRSWICQIVVFCKVQIGFLKMFSIKGGNETLESTFHLCLHFLTPGSSFGLCIWITHPTVPLPRSEVSVCVSGWCLEVVSHFPHCFSWIPPAGPARRISSECVIYGCLTDDGCAVSWWKWSTHPSYHLFAAWLWKQTCI